MGSEATTRGWGWPLNSRKAHYFEAGSLISLCGKWMYAGHREDTMHDHADNCALCKRRRAARHPEPERREDAES